MKVVINKSIGGFGLSEKAVKILEAKGHDPWDFRTLNRDHPDLIEIVETLGDEASGIYSRLVVVEIPDGVDFIICEDDTGEEWIAEKHRTWS